ncbi:cystatin-like [Ambystoma mexicanum]|uniref:cystatin-like n=1 Tax=Ambystoma mexicanum TaxID=8296 RepID=UPI0037E980BE
MVVGWQVSMLAIIAFCSVMSAAMSVKPGGWHEVDVKDKGLKKALTMAMAEHDKMSNDPYTRGIMSISRARMQIVSGVKYDVDVVTGLTTCLKTKLDTDYCPFQESPELLKRSKCRLSLYYVPWTNTLKILSKLCQ